MVPGKIKRKKALPTSQLAASSIGCTDMKYILELAAHFPVCFGKFRNNLIKKILSERYGTGLSRYYIPRKVGSFLERVLRDDSINHQFDHQLAANIASKENDVPGYLIITPRNKCVQCLKQLDLYTFDTRRFDRSCTVIDTHGYSVYARSFKKICAECNIVYYYGLYQIKNSADRADFLICDEADRLEMPLFMSTSDTYFVTKSLTLSLYHLLLGHLSITAQADITNLINGSFSKSKINKTRKRKRNVSGERAKLVARRLNAALLRFGVLQFFNDNVHNFRCLRRTLKNDQLDDMLTVLHDPIMKLFEQRWFLGHECSTPGCKFFLM